MKKLFPILLLFFILLPLGGISETITIAADPWLPYTGNLKQGKVGYLIEIAQAVFESHGIKVEYKTLPWTRAVEEGRKGTLDAIAGAYKTDAPDFVFSGKSEGISIEYFYALPGKSWRFKGASSLEEISLGVANGYSYGEIIDTYIQKNQSNPKRVQAVSGEDPLYQNLMKLQKGRIDALLESKNVVDYLIQDRKLELHLETVGVNGSHEVYIAFSPKNSKSPLYAKLLQEGVEKLRSSGKLKTILDSYGIKDWVP
ncbi:MAG: transporter substrate-binding domain-containing protein [Verrucomicrobiota bacterium]